MLYMNVTVAAAHLYITFIYLYYILYIRVNLSANMCVPGCSEFPANFPKSLRIPQITRYEKDFGVFVHCNTKPLYCTWHGD